MKLTLTLNWVINFLAVKSSNMDFLLVLPLILAVLSAGQSNAEVTSPCYSKCRAGYHRVEDKDACATDQFRCEKCENNTFTAVPNTLLKCLRCGSCGHYEMEIQSCLPDRNVECDCKTGYYSTHVDRKDCQLCPPLHHNGGGRSNQVQRRGAVGDFERWQRCLGEPECQRKCVPLSSTIPNPTTTSFETSSATTMTASSTSTSASNSTNPVKTPLPPSSAYPSVWLFIAVLVATFLALSLLLLLFARNPIRYPDCCPCWRVNKALEPPVEDPIFSDQRSHQGSSPTTLILNISEETPMMPLSQSPAPSEYPAHISRALLDAEHKTARQEEPLEHWPAIVLYAIIKEVPLRRWKEFLRLLSVADQQLERVELEAGLGLGSMERQYQMLRLWSQRSTSSLNDVFSALHYMDLSGCAQLLQESLDKLQ